MDQTELNRSKEQVEELLHRGQAYASQLGTRAQELGVRAQEQLRERPFVAVAGAVAIGFIVGALLARRSRP